MTYGPNDHSAIGAQLKAAYDGTLRYIALGDLGISPVYVDESPPASSQRSTAVASASRTSSAART